MQLEDFIEETLIAICNGVKKAKLKLNVDNPVIAPGRIEGKMIAEVRYIDFEVLVSVNENNQLQVEGGLSGKASIGFAKAEGSVDGNMSKSAGQMRTNKICFSIPYLPEGI